MAVPSLKGSMSLPLLSVEALSAIALLLSGNDIFRLNLCGNRLLWSKIVMAKPAMRCLVRPLQPFPFAAFSMPQLKILDVSLPEDYAESPIRLNRQLPLPAQPVTTLESLSFNFTQSFRVLSLVEEYSVLGTSFPNLTSLELSGSSVGLSFEHLRALPRTLKRLSIAGPFVVRPVHVPYLELLHLPPPLESLTLIRTFISQNSQTGSFDGLVWPPNLTHLKLDKVANATLLLFLPPAVEKLDLRLANATSPISMRTSELPRTLKKIRISPLKGNIVADGIFPPNLVVYDAPPTFSKVEELEGMPSTIKKFNYSEDLLLIPGWLQQRFPCLKVSPWITNENTIVNLPRRLKSLPLASAEPNKIPWSSLPPHLSDVYIAVSSAEHVASLPRSVIELELTEANFDSTPPLEENAFSALPPRLVVFHFCLHMLSSVACLSHLPTSLTKLKLFANFKTPEAIANDESLLLHLPILSHLSYLHLSISHVECAWREWITSLRTRTPKLENLTVSIMGNSQADALRDPTHSHLSHLPETLETAYLPIYDGIGKETDILAKLPKRLISLTLVPMQDFSADPEENGNGLANEQLQYLPKTLTRLDLSSVETLTPKCMDFLPTNISRLVLPNAFSKLRKTLRQSYYSHERWEGYSGP